VIARRAALLAALLIPAAFSCTAKLTSETGVSVGWAALAQRPLKKPALSDTSCPVSIQGAIPDSGVGLAAGAGPLIAVGLGRGATTTLSAEDAFPRYKVLLVLRPGFTGPLLVRSAATSSRDGILFRYNMPDGSTGRWRGSLRLVGTGDPGWGQQFTGYMKAPQAGCYAIQVDYAAGTEQIIQEITPNAG